MSPVAAPRAEEDGPEKQKELHEAVLALDSHWDDEQLAYLKQDKTLARYLKARKGHVPHAAKLLAATLRWRKSMRLDTLSVNEFSRELATGKMYVMGPDDEGHAILITRKRSDAFRPGENEHYLRGLTLTLETCVRTMAHTGQHQWVWILDMKGYTRANSPPLSVSLATLRVLADHYPERLKVCFFVDAPAVFSWLWAALSKLLDPVTQKKVHFLHSADLPKSLPPSSTPANGHHGDHGAPASPAPHVAAGHSASVQAFLPYLRYHLEPYDEKAFRALLERCGWPLVAPPPPAATN